MTNDAAVAWMGPNGHLIDNARFQSRLDGTPDFGDLSGYQPLVHATTVAELRAEVEAWQSQCEGLNESRREEMARADAAERRVAELQAALEGVMYWDNGKSEWAEARAALTKETP